MFSILLSSGLRRGVFEDGRSDGASRRGIRNRSSRSVSGDPVAGLPGIEGTFKGGGAHAVNFGAVWKW